MSTARNFFGMMGDDYIMIDPDAIAYYNLITGIRRYKKPLDLLVINLKNEGLWSKIRFIYPFIGNGQTDHKWNLKNPSDSDAAHRLTFNGSPTCDPIKGIYFDGTTYANPYFNISGLDRNDFGVTHFCPAQPVLTNVNTGLIYGGRNNTSESHVYLTASRSIIRLGDQGDPTTPFGEGTNRSITTILHRCLTLSKDLIDDDVYKQAYNGTEFIKVTRGYSGATASNRALWIGAANEITPFFQGWLQTFVHHESLSDADCVKINIIIQNFNFGLKREIIP